MKFDVDDKNRCRLVCVEFHLNRCRFAAAVAKCLGGSLFWDTVYIASKLNEGRILRPRTRIGPLAYLGFLEGVTLGTQASEH